MDGVSELANMFKERDNRSYIGPIIGEVISPVPNIKIKLGNTIILDSQHLEIASHIYLHYKNIDGTYLLPNDKVILIPSTDEQTYFLIDKVVTL